MTGHTAARSENALRDFHSMDIFRRSFGAHQNDRHFRAVSRLLDGLVSREDDLPDRGTGRGGKALRQHVDLLPLLIQAWHQKIVELVGFNAKNCFFLLDQPLIDHL